MGHESRHRLGVDLGGSKIEAAILDESNTVIARHRVVTPQSGYTDVLESIRELTWGLEQQAGIAKPLPLGIGTPGSPSPVTGQMRNSNSIALNGRQLQKDLEAHCRRPVRLANDADCFTLSEAIDGAARNSEIVFGVILGTGVGGGVCLNRTILSGPNRICGEWGHNRLPLERVSILPTALKFRRLCYCGRRDCVETWLSGPGLAATHLELHGTTLDVEKLHDEPLKTLYQDSIGVYSALLAAALASVVNVIDPHSVVLGGGLSNIDHLYELLPDLLAKQVFSDVCKTSICAAMHGDSSGVRGAAWLWES